MARKSLTTISFPVTLGMQAALDANDEALIVELYLDGPDGIVKARVIDPPPVPGGLMPGDRVKLGS
jgi:hypothetical protein